MKTARQNHICAVLLMEKNEAEFIESEKRYGTLPGTGVADRFRCNEGK